MSSHKLPKRSIHNRNLIICILKIVINFFTGIMMGILYSCCCGGEREGIEERPLLREPEVYTPSNVPIEQYNNPGNVASSHLGSNERTEINGSFRQIGKFCQHNHNK